MDSFYQKQHKCCCSHGGGLHCSCCNPFYGRKNKRKLNRMARSKFKKETNSLIEEGIKNE